MRPAVDNLIPRARRHRISAGARGNSRSPKRQLHHRKPKEERHDRCSDDENDSTGDPLREVAPTAGITFNRLGCKGFDKRKNNNYEGSNHEHKRLARVVDEFEYLGTYGRDSLFGVFDVPLGFEDEPQQRGMQLDDHHKKRSKGVHPAIRAAPCRRLSGGIARTETRTAYITSSTIQNAPMVKGTRVLPKTSVRFRPRN